ncbi:hypothetical protein QTO34_002077 [Cnephaeus nilssonii]|uniref:Uncharacterized protein n=1 Tax=Cnephaeus nilssonii TaxID=3371016 RepID=A0AA40HU78_CNENI|nr:hypothetical protein QTO34_002077 [Eptesicus nilssonii]
MPRMKHLLLLRMKHLRNNDHRSLVLQHQLFPEEQVAVVEFHSRNNKTEAGSKRAHSPGPCGSVVGMNQDVPMLQVQSPVGEMVQLEVHRFGIMGYGKEKSPGTGTSPYAQPPKKNYVNYKVL